MPQQFQGASNMTFNHGSFIDVGRDYNHTDNSYRPQNSHNGNFNLGTGNGTSRGNDIAIGTNAAKSSPWANEQAEPAWSEASNNVASNVPNEVDELIQKLQSGGYSEKDLAAMRDTLAFFMRQLSSNNSEVPRNEFINHIPQGVDSGAPRRAIEAYPQTTSSVSSNNTPIHSPPLHVSPVSTPISPNLTRFKSKNPFRDLV